MVILVRHDEEGTAFLRPLELLGQVLALENDTQLRDYLLGGQPCDLVVAAADGGAGMNFCTTAHERRTGVPLLWITEQKEFEPQSWRTPVDAFLVKPVEPSTVFATAQRLLEQGARAAPDMVGTFAFCCYESEKVDYFKQIWAVCTACRKRPAIYHAADAAGFWRQMETQPLEGALILLPDAEGKALYEEIRERCPEIKTICFYTPEGEEFASPEPTILPYPVTREQMEQALRQFDIVPPAEDDLVRQIVVRPGCLTPDNIKPPPISQVT